VTNNETSCNDFKIEIKMTITPTQTNSLTKLTFIYQILFISNYRPYGKGSQYLIFSHTSYFFWFSN